MSDRHPQHRVIDAASHYSERMAIFESERPEAGGIVFLGSSHFEWFDTARFLPGRYIVNRGIASDRLGIGERGILRRLDVSVYDCEPSFILFQNGVNDIGELARTGEPAFERICACYDTIVFTIRAHLPEVPMCCAGEIPTRGRFANCQPHIPPFNEHVARVAATHGCQYEDAFSLVVDDDGQLRADLTYDGLHLNDKGYAIWAAHLDTILPPSASSPRRL